MMDNANNVSSSFRDPSGFVFFEGNTVYRKINPCYFEEYNNLNGSGLYKLLIDAGILIRHEEIEATKEYKVIRPEKVPFISYPYEWCFSQLKDAALLTLAIQRQALEKGFSLKDASAYNVQFLGYRPIFIDTLSFETYKADQPWVAFGQFCKHFLYPLLLMSKIDLRLNALLKIWIDGIPLDIVNGLMPAKAYFSLTNWLYVKFPFFGQNKHQNKKKRVYTRLSKNQLCRILEGLENSIKKLKPKNKATEWGEYYTFTNYSKNAFSEKEQLVQQLIKEVCPKTTWDLGANDGCFSRLSSENGIKTVAFDIDPVAVEKNYLKARYHKEENLLPLLMDLTNPSSSLGWAHQERDSLLDRGPADLGLVLALVHHLAIGNNVPFPAIASYFSKLFKSLIIEFIPKEDNKVQELLCNRRDIFPEYDQVHFEEAFSKMFIIEKKITIKESIRTLYLMRKL